MKTSTCDLTVLPTASSTRGDRQGLTLETLAASTFQRCTAKHPRTQAEYRLLVGMHAVFFTLPWFPFRSNGLNPNEQDKELGRGTYGRVIQATHRGTGRQYACKVVHVTRMEPRQVSKLFSEVSVLRELDHPHIVRMRQVFYSKVRKSLSSTFCYVKFFASGGTAVLEGSRLGCTEVFRC